MDREELRKSVEAEVARIYEEKEEADIRKKTEESLQQSATTIQELTSSLEEKNSDMETLVAEKAEIQQKHDDLNKELEAAREEITATNEKLAVAKQEIEDMKKDKAMETRMAELVEAKVSKDSEATRAKVREMSDEEFASYKQERVELRAAVLAEITASEEAAAAEKAAADEVAAAAEKAAADKAAADKAAADAAAGDTDDDAGLPAAEVASVGALSAALNLEIVPSKSVMDEYQQLGKAMAALMVDSEDNE